MKGKWIGFGIINAICLIILLLSFAVFIPSFGMWFYLWQFDVNDTYNVVNMVPEDLHEVTRHMIRYMQGNEPDLQIMTMVGGQPRYFFSPIEIRHMIDVYDLFAIGYILIYIAGVLFAATAVAFAAFGRKRLKYLFKSWQWASAAVLALFLTLVAAVAINWHHAFIIFHEIFFDNDYWILDRRVDLLINIVPYEFFITLSIVIGAFFAVGLVIIFALGTILLKTTKLTARAGWRPWVLTATMLVFSLLAMEILGITLLVLLFVLLGIFALALLLLAIVLFCKIKYRAEIKKQATDAPWEYSASVSLFWGILRKGFAHDDQEPEPEQKQDVVIGKLSGLFSKDDKGDGDENEAEAEVKKGGRGIAKSVKGLKNHDFANIRAIVAHSLELAKKVFKICRPKVFVVRGRYGAEEPHTTGLVIAAAGVVATMLDIDAGIEGDFEKQTLEIDAVISGYLRPWALVLPAVKYIFKPEIKKLIFGRKQK